MVKVMVNDEVQTGDDKKPLTFASEADADAWVSKNVKRPPMKKVGGKVPTVPTVHIVPA